MGRHVVIAAGVGAGVGAAVSVVGIFREEVERGAAFLDARRPGWREIVDLDRLELSRCTTCVLGQLAGVKEEVEWEVVLSEFGLDWEQEDDIRLGFNNWDTDETWAALTGEWRKYIRETRSAVTS